MTAEVKNGDKLVITLPVASVSKDLSFKMEANSAASRKKIQIYKYKLSNEYQNVGLIFKEPYTAKDSKSFQIAPRGELIIEKVAVVDGKESKLSGVVLVLKDSKGNVVAKWNTKDENPKSFKNLPIGETYTIIEESAPEEYIKLGEMKVTVTSPTPKKVKVVNHKTQPIAISKKDVTNEAELPGATLVVKNSKGEVIDTWVSGDTPHYITKHLPEGTYYLSETIAPAGYVKSTTTVEFKVNAKGEVDGVVTMYNSPNRTLVSKKDVENNKELAGATLVVKDANGKVVDRWVSTNEPHYIEGLEPGSYTLCEPIAPAGYKLKTTCITFNLKADGVTKIVTIIIANNGINIIPEIPIFSNSHKIIG